MAQSESDGVDSSVSTGATASPPTRDGSEQVVAKVDTGADRTSIGVELAAELGTGPITGYTTVRSPSHDRGKTRPLVDVHVAITDEWEPATASVEDRSHMNYPVILGKDLLTGYRIDVDRRADESGHPAGTGGRRNLDEE